SEPIQEFVWGRKRTQLNAIPLPNAKIVRTDSNKTELQNLQKQVDMMNRSLHFCDELLRMFDELIIPAARLLDTVETKLKDVRLKNVTNRIEENTVAKQAITTILPPTIISNKQEQKSPIPLSNYKTVVYEESELIEWGRNNCYQDHQSKQAEEEAETDEEMIDYGRKIANKNVRIAIRSIKNRDWSIRSRMEHYKQSIKRLEEANRRRGK
ncbi:hypothetical protein WA538_002310, partial [Blastocystis sp. DL]